MKKIAKLETPFRKMALINLAGMFMLFTAYLQGWVQHVFRSDSSHMTVLIAVVFFGGVLATLWQAWAPATNPERARMNLQAIRYVGTTLVMLGLLGTVIGAFKAFQALDPAALSDHSKGVIMTLKSLNSLGIGVACTILGCVTNIWTMLNVAIMERYLALKSK